VEQGVSAREMYQTTAFPWMKQNVIFQRSDPE